MWTYHSKILPLQKQKENIAAYQILKILNLEVVKLQAKDDIVQLQIYWYSSNSDFENEWLDIKIWLLLLKTWTKIH